jgi:hypothetical protein
MVITLQHDCHRTIVHEIDLHHRPEEPGLHPVLTKNIGQYNNIFIIKAFGKIRRGGLCKTRTVPFPGVGIQRELRNNKYATSISFTDKFIFPFPSSKIRNAAHRSARYLASDKASPLPTPRKIRRPFGIELCNRPSIETLASRTRCINARIPPYSSIMAIRG